MNGGSSGRVRPAHLVDNHPKRITIGLGGGWAVLTEQEFGAHPTNCPRRGHDSFRQGNCAEVNQQCHKAKICKASGAVVVDENVSLLDWSAKS